MTKIEDLDKVSQGIDKVDDNRKKLEDRLNSIKSLADKLDRDAEKLILKDGFDAKAGNDLMSNKAMRNLDDA